VKLFFYIICSIAFCFSKYAFSLNTVVPKAAIENQYNFSSIEFLIEQEIGRLVLTQIYQNIGIDISISPLPAKRSQYLANSGGNDGEIMRIWTYGNENPNTIRVPTPYYYLETMPFVLKASKINIKKKDELANYRLTKIRGVKHTNNITQGMINIYEMSNTEEMFKLLLSGRVDIALTNTIDGHLTLARLGYDSIKAMEQPLAVLPLYHYLHKDHELLVPLIDREIKRLRNSGALQRLIRKAENKVIALNNIGQIHYKN